MPATDPFKSATNALMTYQNGFAITAHDTNELAHVTRAIYVGSIASGATMTVVTRKGDTVAFAGLVAGSIIPIMAKQVKTTGTLASSLVGLY